jgi:hypothetical protein
MMRWGLIPSWSKESSSASSIDQCTGGNGEHEVRVLVGVGRCATQPIAKRLPARYRVAMTTNAIKLFIVALRS